MIDQLHKVSYSYVNYSLLVKKTYYKENGTLVTEQNTLTSDNKNIAQSIVYTGNSSSNPLSKTTYSYDEKGNMTTKGEYKTNSSAIYTYYTYDSNKQYVTEVKQNNITNKMEYDALGNVTKATDGNGNTVTYTYDIYGNQTGSNDGKYTTRTVYDYAGNNVTYYDENNKGKLYDYNAIGNLMLVKDVSTGITIASYTYNNDMMLESAVIGTKSKMTVEYNLFDEVSAKNWVDRSNLLNASITSLPL